MHLLLILLCKAMAALAKPSISASCCPGFLILRAGNPLDQGRALVARRFDDSCAH